MKNTLILLVIVGLGVLLFVVFSGDKEFDPADVKNYPPEGQTIVAFGDSLVVGVGADTPGGFVTLLSNELDVSIENLGRGGDTTTNGLERLGGVLEHKPDIVLLLLGGNDFLDRKSEEEVLGNLETIITRLQDRGSIVVLLGIRGGLLGDGYKKDFEKLAGKYDTAYVPDVLDGLIGESEFMDDAIHPNEKGYTVIAERIAPILAALLN